MPQPPFDALPAARLPAPNDAARWPGTWGGDASTALFRFSLEAGELVLEAWNDATGEPLLLSEARWDGEAFAVRTTLPSNGWTASHRFQLAPEETLLWSWTYKGGQGQAELGPRQAAHPPALARP